MTRRPATSRVPSLLARARAAGMRNTLRALVPRRIDQLLYATDPDMARASVECALPVQVHRYDQGTPSGDPDIDRRLNAWRVCYLATVDGAYAHQSWLHFDTTLPAVFGHDRTIPVIGSSHTYDRFRGMHLYGFVLHHVLSDVHERGLGREVFMMVSPRNAPSIAGIERAGFELRARLRGIRIGPVVIRRDRGWPALRWPVLHKLVS